MLTLVWNAIRLAAGAIARNKLRAALTSLGILIGTASVVAVTALAGSASDIIVGSLDSFGTNMVSIYPEQVLASGAHTKPTGRLTEGDARAIEREAVSVSGATPFLGTNGQVVFEDKNVNTFIAGISLSYIPIRKWAISRGSAWTESDEQIKSKVCLIGSTTAKKLFGDKDPVGQVIRIVRAPFKIVGVLEERGSGSVGPEDQDDRVMMPIGSFRARIRPTAPGRADQIMASARTRDTTDRAVDQITSILRQRHHLDDGAPPDFKVVTLAQMIQFISVIVGSLRKLLFAVAAVSLLVGGIGVMNIMLVSVAERTREIGIRMSIGARENDILIQFLVEAVILTLIGGSLGIVVGVGMIRAAASALGWSMLLGPESLMIATGTSVAIGLIFGYFPARRAAKLDPIEALRVD